MWNVISHAMASRAEGVGSFETGASQVAANKMEVRPACAGRRCCAPVSALAALVAAGTILSLAGGATRANAADEILVEIAALERPRDVKPQVLRHVHDRGPLGVVHQAAGPVAVDQRLQGTEPGQGKGKHGLSPSRTRWNARIAIP